VTAPPDFVLASLSVVCVCLFLSLSLCVFTCVVAKSPVQRHTSCRCRSPNEHGRPSSWIQSTGSVRVRLFGWATVHDEYTKYLHMQDPGDRLCRLGRLTEEILLDNNSRILEERLNFVRHNAGFRKRVASIAAVRSPQNAAQRVGTVYLPASTPGSPKYQKRLVEQALTVVQKLGQPTYFVTFTCNPKWPEIQENLRPGQISSDRPLLVARVFKLKLASLLKTIQKWDGGCEYYFCTVEFQHRGLPHAHIALKVKNPPSFGSNMQHIQVNMPEASDNRYRQLVGTHMTHGCRRRFADEHRPAYLPSYL
jgi:hypothetical protein